MHGDCPLPNPVKDEHPKGVVRIAINLNIPGTWVNLIQYVKTVWTNTLKAAPKRWIRRQSFLPLSQICRHTKQDITFQPSRGLTAWLVLMIQNSIRAYAVFGLDDLGGFDNFENFDLITNLDVIVVFDADTTFIAILHFLNIIFKPTQRINGPFKDDNIVS